jgi:hypothetical protein
MIRNMGMVPQGYTVNHYLTSGKTEYLYKAKRSLELKWEQEHLDNNRYTLEMVRIDDKVKKIITDIKLEEARIAHLQNNVENVAPEVSVAT